MSKKYGDAQTLEKHMEEALQQNLMLRDELDEINRGLIALVMELEEKNHILDIASRHSQLVPFLNETLAYLKDYTGCAAVGIRLLDEEGNIPYQAYDGFSQSFYDEECPLSIKTDRCMCVNVITGTTDPDQPFHTRGGSFYMNGATKLLATVPEEYKGQTRNACNQAGYESVALIPIRLRDTLGLMHIADPREGMVPLDMVEALERAAMQLGTTIVRLRAQEALQESESIYRALIETTDTGYVIIDSEGAVVDANREYARLAGYSDLNEIRGKSVLEWTADYDKERTAAAVAKCIRDGFIRNLEINHLNRFGKIAPVEINATVMFRDNQLQVLTLCRDITRRKQVEEELLESEEKYRMIFNATGTAAMILEEDTTISLINRGFETLSGYSKEEIEGKKSWKEFFSQGYLDDMIEYHNLRRVDPDFAPKEYETEFITRKGDVRQVIDTVSMISGTNQSIVFLLDISGIKQAERATKQGEEKFRTLFEEAPVGVGISRAGNTLMANQAYLGMFAYASVTELEGTPLIDQIAPQCRSQIEESLRRREQGKEVPRAYETVGLRKDGSQFPLYIEAARIELPDGPATIGYFSDTTERKLAEEALKQSEEKYRSLIVNLNDVIFSLNAEGYVTYISPVVELFAGYKAEDAIGQPFMSYIHPEDRPVLLESFERSLDGQVKPAEFRLLRKEGTYIYVRAVSRRIVENGQASLTGVLSDITERKRAEDELRESHGKLAKTFEQTVESLASIAEMRDPYTAGHQVRVASLGCRIASEIGMPAEQIGAIRTAAMLHDIGKIIVPSEILNKPGRLSVLERSFVGAHAQASYEILKNIEFEFPIAEIILQHHEKLDGSGYPRGLSGDSILKEARVLTVADVIEAMASHRPYRPALPLKTALEEISSHRGTLYDADVVDACLRLFLEKGFRQLIWH